ncbi:hypothetical protein pb186bvf_014458 [Paramecium bursaria]
MVLKGTYIKRFIWWIKFLFIYYQNQQKRFLSFFYILNGVFMVDQENYQPLDNKEYLLQLQRMKY